MTRWVVDTEHVVHVTGCAKVDEPSLPYVCMPMGMGMQAWLARRDVHAGHRGQGMLRACPACTEGEVGNGSL